MASRQAPLGSAKKGCENYTISDLPLFNPKNPRQCSQGFDEQFDDFCSEMDAGIQNNILWVQHILIMAKVPLFRLGKAEALGRAGR